MIEIDRESLLVHASAEVTLGALEDALRDAGLTLDLDALPRETTVKALIEGGATGAPSPWNDPADHLFAGLVAEPVHHAMAKRDARETSREPLVVRPIPRRAVGPDLTALVVGHGARFFALTSVWLRVHLRVDGHAQRPRPIPFSREEPALTTGETALWDRIATELARIP